MGVTVALIPGAKFNELLDDVVVEKVSSKPESESESVPDEVVDPQLIKRLVRHRKNKII